MTRKQLQKTIRARLLGFGIRVTIVWNGTTAYIGAKSKMNILARVMSVDYPLQSQGTTDGVLIISFSGICTKIGQ